MGLEGLQKYIESKLGHCIDKNVDLKSTKNENTEETKTSKKEPQIFVVHADSCRKYVYPVATDWVCGGQWNEMLSNLERFVRCFRQSSIELVVFFDGSVGATRFNDWKQRHTNQRETVKQLMSKVVSNRATPARSLAVTPACFNTALRLALKSCNVIVCSSVGDLHHDITSYYRSQRCTGIIAQNSHYLLQRISNCFSPDHLKIGRYTAKSSRIDFGKVMEELGLSSDTLPVFAALLGNNIIPEGYLATFHWSFLGPDHPLKSEELKGNISYQSAPPPVEIVIKGLADFLKDRDVDDIDELAKEVFKDSGYDLGEATLKLKEAIDYFKSTLNQKDHKTSKDHDSCLNIDGFPVHSFGPPSQETQGEVPDSKRIENSYQRRWQQFQKVQLSNQQQVKSSQESAKETEDEKECVESKENGQEEEEKAKDEKEKNQEEEPPKREEKNEVEATEEKPAVNGVTEEEKEVKEVDVPSEEVPSEDVPSNELPSEDVPSKDVPSEDVPSEDLPSKDVPSKDVPGEDAPSEGVPGEDAPSEGMPSEEVPNKDIPNKDVSNEDVPNEDVLNEDVPNEDVPSEDVPSEEGPSEEVPGEDVPSEEVQEGRYDVMKPFLPDITEEVIAIARKRHQGGEMAAEILQILTKGEVFIDTAIDEENATMRLPIPLLYRPVRQLIYGILYDQKVYEEKKGETPDEREAENPTYRYVKEYCVYRGNQLDKPDLVEPVSMPWDIPPVKNLWLGRQAQDNTTRMKAFLTCLKSDTQNMSNVAMVPQRMLLLCCVLRYLIQQEGGKSIISRQDIDAFLAQALSSHLTTEGNSMNLAHLKLNQIDVRAMQLASVFMSGVEVAIVANDACGSPVPWEFCCPWLFFDGKLFHSKWLQTSMNVATTELCEGKPKLAEKLERLRWCITEGLGDQYKITGLKPVTSATPFGTPPASLMPAAPYGVNDFRPAGANYQSKSAKGRGASSKRPVLASGGTLEVAGVPVAHWSGNKSGLGYNRDNPDIVVGGRSSVDLPSDSRSGRRGMLRGKAVNRGRGLLPTPLFSPWPIDYDGMRGVQQSFGRGPGNPMPLMPRSGGRPQGRSLYRPGGGKGRQEHGPSGQSRGKDRNTASYMGKPHQDMWVGKGRGQNLGIDDGFIPNEERRGDFTFPRNWSRP